MAIDAQHADYDAALPDWQLADTVCDETDLGSLLPELNAHDQSQENKTRNTFYKERASWFGASSITLQGLIGVAFEDAPEIELPVTLDYLSTNTNGEGLDLQQQMQITTDQVLRKGRAGLFVTFPKTDGDVSVADRLSGKAVSTIHVIDATRVINWWTVSRGAQVILGGVVFTDTREKVKDYVVENEDVIRELFLDGDGGFVDRIWTKPEGKDTWELDPTSVAMPTDGSGKRWNTIPFTFVGSNNNSHRIKGNKAPMLSLCRLNRDHYRNSADNEESLWYAGQAQPYIKPNENLAPDDLEKARKSGFYIGSRQLILGEVGFAQADANTAVRQAMIDKVEAMKAMGARLIQAGGVAKTAQQDAGEQKVAHSVLSLVVENVEDAYNSALAWVSAYMNAQEATTTLSRGFMDPRVNVEMIDRVIALLDRAAIGYADVLPILKRAKLIDDEKDVEDYLEEVDERGGLIGADAGSTD